MLFSGETSTTSHLPSATEEGAVGGAPAEPSSFQMQLMRSLVEEAMEEFRDQMRRDVLNMHMDMLKQFQVQQVVVI